MPAAATTAAASSTASTTTTAAATRSAPPTLWARPCLVHVQPTALQLSAVQICDGRFRLLMTVHFHEAKALGLARELVLDDHRRLHLSVSRKGVTQLVFGHLIGQVPYVNLHLFSFWRLRDSAAGWRTSAMRVRSIKGDAHLGLAPEGDENSGGPPILSWNGWKRMRVTPILRTILRARS